MGKVWLETSDGRLIHLPVVGDDINTPDSVIKISTALILDMNRCYGQQIIVNSSTYGQFTLDLRPNGIIGSCNQCGHCCSHLVEDCPTPPECGWPLRAIKSHPDVHACQYLIISKENKWPQANNTSCALYGDILNTYKGCAYPPKVIKPEWINCGYSF